MPVIHSVMGSYAMTVAGTVAPAAATATHDRISWAPLPARAISSSAMSRIDSTSPFARRSRNQRSNSSSMSPTRGTPTQCDSPPAPTSAIRSSPGKARIPQGCGLTIRRLKKKGQDKEPGKGQLGNSTTHVVALQPETCCSATTFEWVAGGSNPEPTD